ncbi:hypothetical protein DFH07DRAFT_824501 [Mycena maculata]|uniref:Uncharacterized protein n=1 Tax=Mycena maculata TaxID=230809 RepID=A0AAD7IY95_9AGAR|nr:hypothetical protein DFH07DRAFT_824501 [Mycena maculata]
MQFPTPTQPPPPFSPVIDPNLMPPQDRTTNERIHALEREVEHLKAQKRPNTAPDEGSSKHRKKSKKPSPYILRLINGLSSKQIEVRKSLMRKIKYELRQLTGRTDKEDTDNDSDNSDTSFHSPRPHLAFDFRANVDDSVNEKVIDRAVHFVWTEQQDPKSKTFSLPHPDVQFTREDLHEFAKTTFRSWKRNYREESNPEVAKKKAASGSKVRQDMRKKELKANRLKAIPQYRKMHKRNPVFILETDWMSDEISGPDTEDEEEKRSHRRRLVQAARLGSHQQDDPVWEKIRPAFQANELIDIKDELDRINAAKKKAKKKQVRASVPRINLGNTHNRPPTGKIWPFMVSQDWYDTHIEGNAELEDEMEFYTNDPTGFGEVS